MAFQENKAPPGYLAPMTKRERSWAGKAAARNYLYAQRRKEILQATADANKLSYWEDPIRVAGWFNALKNAPEGFQLPEWLDPGMIATAYDYFSKANAGKPDTEWLPLDWDNGFREQLKKVAAPPDEWWDISDPAKLWSAFTVPQEQPETGAVMPAEAGALQYGGMTKEAYDELPLYKKLLANIFGGGPTTGAAMAAVSAPTSLAGPGLLTTPLAGAGLARAFGSLYDFSPTKKIAEAFMIAFNWPTEQVEKMLGTAMLLAGSFKPGGISPMDVLSNLDDAWKASRLTYEVTPVQEKMGLLERLSYAVPIIGLGKGLEQVSEYLEPTKWGKEITAIGAPEVLRLEDEIGFNALEKAFSRIVSGEDPAKVVNSYLYTPAGNLDFSRQMKDMVGQTILDPLNFAGILMARGAGLTVKGMVKLGAIEDAPRLVNSLNKSRGLFEAWRNYTRDFLAFAQQVGPGAEKFNAIQKWIARPAKIIEAGAIVRPVSTGRKIAQLFYNKIPALAVGNLPGGLIGMGAFGVAVEGGMRAAGYSDEEIAEKRNAINLGGFVLGTLGMHLATGGQAWKGGMGWLFSLTPKAQALEATHMTADNINEMSIQARDVYDMKRQYDTFRNINEDGAITLGKWAYAPNADTMRTAIKSFTGDAVRLAQWEADAPLLRMSEEIAAQRAVDLGKEFTTNDLVKELGKLGITGDKVKKGQKVKGKADPAKVKALAIELNKTPEEVQALFNTFIRDNHPINFENYRVMLGGDLMEHTEKWLVKALDLHPDPAWYRSAMLMKNVQGFLFLDVNPAFFLQNYSNNILSSVWDGTWGRWPQPKIDAYIKDAIGFEPSRVFEGYGGVDELLGGKQLVGEYVQAGLKSDDAISKLGKRFNDVREAMGPVSLLNQSARVESKARATVYVNVHQRAMAEAKRVLGLLKIPDNISRILGPDGARRASESLHKLNNMLDVEDFIFDGKAYFDIDNVLEEFEPLARGALVDSGLLKEWHEVQGEVGADRVKFSKFVNDFVKAHEAELTKAALDDLDAEIKSIPTKIRSQGAISLNENIAGWYNERAELYNLDAQELDKVAYETLQMTNDVEKGKLWGDAFARRSERWNRHNNKIRAVATEWAKQMGADNKLAAKLANRVIDYSNHWDKFFVERDALWKKARDNPEFFQGDYSAVRQAINDLYKKYSDGEFDKMGKINDAIAKLIEAQKNGGPEVAKTFLADAGKALNVRRKLRDAYLEHYERIGKLDVKERYKAWQEFTNDVRRVAWKDELVANLAAIDNLAKALKNPVPPAVTPEAIPTPEAAPVAPEPLPEPPPAADPFIQQLRDEIVRWQKTLGEAKTPEEAEYARQHVESFEAELAYREKQAAAVERVADAHNIEQAKVDNAEAASDAKAPSIGKLIRDYEDSTVKAFGVSAGQAKTWRGIVDRMDEFLASHITGWKRGDYYRHLALYREYPGMKFGDMTRRQIKDFFKALEAAGFKDNILARKHLINMINKSLPEGAEKFSWRHMDPLPMDAIIALLRKEAADGKIRPIPESFFKGMEQVAITPEGKVAKGMYRRLDDMSFIIKGFARPDFSTMVHETWHTFVDLLPEEETRVLGLWLKDSHGVNVEVIGGKFIGDEAEVARANELCARAGEEFFAKNALPDNIIKSADPKFTKIKTIFSNFRDWMLGIYHGVKEGTYGGTSIDVQISPEVESMFQRILNLKANEMVGRRIDLDKPYSPRPNSVLRARIAELEARIKKLSTSEVSDLPFYRANEAEVNAAPAIASMDVTGLGWVNGRFTQRGGDKLLKTLGIVAKDIEAKYKGVKMFHVQGDEFLLIGPDVDIVGKAATEMAQNMQTTPILFEGADLHEVYSGFQMHVGVDTNRVAAEKSMKLAKDAYYKTYNLKKGDMPQGVTKAGGGAPELFQEASPVVRQKLSQGWEIREEAPEPQWTKTGSGTDAYHYSDDETILLIPWQDKIVGYGVGGRWGNIETEIGRWNTMEEAKAVAPSLVQIDRVYSVYDSQGNKIDSFVSLDFAKREMVNERGLIELPDSFPEQAEGVIPIVSKKNDFYVYRGISRGEMENIVKTGKLKSRGEYNFSTEAGYTMFGEYPATAEAYASSFAPVQYRPTPEKPGYILEVKRQPSMMTQTQTGYIYTLDTLPTDQIVRVTEIRVDETGYTYRDVTDLFKKSAEKGEMLFQPEEPRWIDLPDGRRVKVHAEDETSIQWQDENGVLHTIDKTALPPNGAGPLPPETITGMSGQPPTAKLADESWFDVMPAIRELERKALENGANKGLANRQLSPEEMREVKTWLRAKKNDMSDARVAAHYQGLQAADFAMLNYNRRYGMDMMTSAVLPYIFWITRSAPNWFMRLLDHPQYFMWWARIRSMIGMNEEAEGYPSRLQGKIRLNVFPFIPGFAEVGVYADPLKQFFPFEQIMKQLPWYKSAQEETSQDRAAEYNIYSMVADGEITEEQGKQAILTKTGEAWEQARAKAEQEQADEIANPWDYFSAISGPMLPISLMMNYFTGRKDNISITPLSRTIQNFTALFKPGGVNIEGGIREKMGLPSGEQFDDYYIRREITNMVMEGSATLDDALKAFVERQGPVYEQALDRAGKYKAIRNFLSVISVDLFPEGEAATRALKNKFIKEVSNGKKTFAEFIDENPQYEAIVYRGQEDPVEAIRYFLRSQIWEQYNALPDLHKKQVRQQFGSLFRDYFVSREKRNYDAISTEDMVAWAKALGGYAPTTAPQVASAALNLAGDEASQMYQTFITEREKWFGTQVTSLSYQYGQLRTKQEKDDFLDKYPYLKSYWSWRKGMFATYPGLEEMSNIEDDFSTRPGFDLNPADFSEELVSQLYGYFYANQDLGAGARSQLYQLYVKYGEPGNSFNAFLQMLRSVFDPASIAD